VTVYVCNDPACIACDYLATDKICSACKDTYKFSSNGICELCGNGLVEGDEICDAGTALGCIRDCLEVNPQYSCTGGSPTSPSICTSQCGVCGDGVVNSGE